MTFLLSTLLVAAVVAAVLLWMQRGAALRRASHSAREASAAAMRLAEAQNRCSDLEAQINALAKYRAMADADNFAGQVVVNAEAEAADILARAREAAKLVHAEATQVLQSAATDSANLKLQARGDLKASQAKGAALEEAAQKAVYEARAQAAQLIEEARQRAREIGGDAYAALERVAELKATAEAMRGVIEGYGDDHIVPTFSLLDALADEFGHAEAGASLKRCREVSREMVRTGKAAECDYVESTRRDTAVRFITDAFNGKVDSILSRVRTENHGKLEQEIRGGFHLVNRDGAAFRSARITPAYLDARLDELRWAASVHALQLQEREEQRRLREQLREEERARREYERAIKEAAQEESAIKKAMERVQAQVAKATDEQRAAFEAKLQELQDKLATAEERGRRALSMAQQTKVGHVYVISNVGSFGESVFKIGMTRRLEPTDRVRELGDASVPFEFDVHAMIYSEDAPALERSLHLHFMRAQVNKVNPRKEFFRLGVDAIRSHVDNLGITAHWTLASKAHDYRETLRIERELATNPEVAREWTQYQVAAELAISNSEEQLVESVE